MKKITTILLCMFMCLCLVSCASKDTGNSTDSNSTSGGGNNSSGSSTGTNEEAEIVVTVDEAVLFDEQDVRVTLKEYDGENTYGPSFKISVENNKDKAICLQCDYVTVNGYTFDPLLSCVVNSKDTADDVLTLPKEDVELCGIKYVKDVTVSFNILDEETFEKDGDSVIADFTTRGAETYEQNYDYDGLEIFNQDGVRALMKMVNSKDSDTTSVYIYTENSTDKDLTVENEDTSVNGYKVYAYYSAYVPAGTRRISQMGFSKEEFDEKGFSEIFEIKSGFCALDSEESKVFTVDPVSISFK